jgi:hypothetical protein
MTGGGWYQWPLTMRKEEASGGFGSSEWRPKWLTVDGNSGTQGPSIRVLPQRQLGIAAHGPEGEER